MQERRWKHAVGPVGVTLTITFSGAYLRPEDIPVAVADDSNLGARLGHEFGGGTPSTRVYLPVEAEGSTRGAATAAPPANSPEAFEGFTVILRSDEDSGH